MGIERCRIIQLPKITDQRGSLSFIEGRSHVPFEIKRVFYLHDIPSGSARGAHAHRTLQEFIIPVAGSFDVVLRDGEQERHIHLDRPDHGLYLCPMIWIDLISFSTESVCLVLASEHYDESKHIREYGQYLAEIGHPKA